MAPTQPDGAAGTTRGGIKGADGAKEAGPPHNGMLTRCALRRKEILARDGPRRPKPGGGIDILYRRGARTLQIVGQAFQPEMTLRQAGKPDLPNPLERR